MHLGTWVTMSYHGAIGRLVITDRTHCLSFWLHTTYRYVYIHICIYTSIHTHIVIFITYIYFNVLDQKIYLLSVYIYENSETVLDVIRVRNSCINKWIDKQRNIFYLLLSCLPVVRLMILHCRIFPFYINKLIYVMSITLR